MRDELESAFCHPCTNWNSSSEGRLEDPNDNDEGIHPHPDRLLLTGTSEHQSLINKSVCLCWDHLCRLRTFLKQKWSQIVRAYFNKITFLTIKWYGSNYFTRPMYQLDSSMNMVKEWYMSCRELPRNSISACTIRVTEFSLCVSKRLKNLKVIFLFRKMCSLLTISQDVQGPQRMNSSGFYGFL